MLFQNINFLCKCDTSLMELNLTIMFLPKKCLKGRIPLFRNYVFFVLLFHSHGRAYCIHAVMPLLQMFSVAILFWNTIRHTDASSRCDPHGSERLSRDEHWKNWKNWEKWETTEKTEKNKKMKKLECEWTSFKTRWQLKTQLDIQMHHPDLICYSMYIGWQLTK